MPITPNAVVITAATDPALRRVVDRDEQTIILSTDGTVLLDTDKNVQVNLFEQVFQQNYVTTVNQVNNPGGNLDGEIQLKSGASFGASGNLIFDRNTGILSIPRLATDNLLYSNGAAWNFSQGSGIAYGNTNVEDWLNTGANSAVSIARGISTGSGNAQVNILTANSLQYPNGSPFLENYTDLDVRNLLNAGSNAGVTIESVVANGSFVANNNIITNQALYVRPSVGSSPEGNRSAVLPGLPSDLDAAVSNIYNIGSVTRTFRNVYAGGTVFAAAANIQGALTVTGNITGGNVYANSGAVVATNIVSINIITSNATVNGNVTATSANITLSLTAAAANISALNSPGFTSNSTTSTFTSAIVLDTAANLTANVTQLRITGGNSGQFLTTNGSGTVSWANVVTAAIVNGNSNVFVYPNSVVTVSAAGTANVAVFSNTGANLANLTVAGTSYLGNAGAITILGGSPDYVLSTDGQGNLSWQQGGTTNFYSGNAAASASIATNSQINAALPAGVTARNGDIFMDTNAAAQNQQPVYINVNGQWRQFLTAFGGL